MNDPKGYTKALDKFAQEAGSSLSIFYRQAANDRRLNIHLILDSPSQEAESIFLKKFRTQPVDIDGRGEPCKERCAQVLETITLKEVPNTRSFTCIESTGWQISGSF